MRAMKTLYRSLHTSRTLYSTIKKESYNQEPHGGAGIARGDLKRTLAATAADKYHHLPPGWPVTDHKEGRYYELACAGVDRPHKGWDTWKAVGRDMHIVEPKREQDLVAPKKGGAKKAKSG